jgi:hypothetical protein
VEASGNIVIGTSGAAAIAARAVIATQKNAANRRSELLPESYRRR